MILHLDLEISQCKNYMKLNMVMMYLLHFNNNRNGLIPSKK